MQLPSYVFFICKIDCPYCTLSLIGNIFAVQHLQCDKIKTDNNTAFWSWNIIALSGKFAPAPSSVHYSKKNANVVFLLTLLWVWGPTTLPNTNFPSNRERERILGCRGAYCTNLPKSLPLPCSISMKIKIYWKMFWATHTHKHLVDKQHT